MNIITENNKIKLIELQQLAAKMFGNLVKAVVDIEKNIMVVDAELHSDAENLLLENNSKQDNLWGINIYPNLEKKDWVEFDSLINIRPMQNNYSRGIDNFNIQEKIKKLVYQLVGL